MSGIWLVIDYVRNKTGRQRYAMTQAVKRAYGHFLCTYVNSAAGGNAEKKLLAIR